MRYLSAILLLLAAALLTGAPLAAQPALTGPDFYVDLSSQATPPTFQTSPAAATDDTGNCMVVWVERKGWFDPGEPGNLRGRVYDPSGKPVGPAFALGTGTLGPVALAPAAPDGFLLVWDSHEKIRQVWKHRLLARRLSPTGRLRGDVIQVRMYVPDVGGRGIGSIQAAAAPDGSFTVVWGETKPDDIFFRSFDVAGRPLAIAAPVPGGGSDPRFSPSLGVLANGELRIGWISRSSLWVRRFDRNGAPLADPVTLLPTNAQAQPVSVTFGPGGVSLAAWKFNSVSYVRAFTRGGRPFPEHEVAIYVDQVTATEAGTYLLSSSSCAASLLLEADGTPRGPLGCSSTGSAYSVAGRKDGGLALFSAQDAWDPEAWGDGVRLHSQFLATAGPGTLQIERARSAVLESAAGPFELRILRLDGMEGAVSVDYRLTGAAAGGGTVTFPDGDSTPRAISIPVSDDGIPGNDRVVRVALSQPTGGAVLGLPRRAVVEIRDDDAPSPLLARAEPLREVASGDQDTGLTAPGLAVSPSGEIEVVWRYVSGRPGYHPVPFHMGIQGQRFDAAGQPMASFDQGPSAIRVPERLKLAMHPEGDFMLFWQEVPVARSFYPSFAVTGDREGWAERFDAGGAAVKWVYLQFLPDDAAPLPQDRFVAVGRNSNAPGAALYAHFLSTQGLDRRSPVLVTSEALEPGSPAAVAADRSGRSVVVWSVAPSGAGPAGIFAQRFNALGAPLGGPFRVSQWEGHDLAPSVSTDAQGNFIVAWQRGAGIYARAFNAEGAPQGDEIAVDSAAVEDQAPSVALTGDGRFAVLWQSSWSSGGETVHAVRGQLFAGAGTRLGSEVKTLRRLSTWRHPTSPGAAGVSSRWSSPWAILSPSADSRSKGAKEKSSRSPTSLSVYGHLAARGGPPLGAGRPPREVVLLSLCESSL
jgi:hypothetical protein